MKAVLLALTLLSFSSVAFAANPKSSLAYQSYSRGVELSAHKKWDEALEKFQNAIDLNPGYVASYIEYARAAVMSGKRTQGLKKLASALEFAKSKADKEKILKERENLSDIFYTNETFQQYQNGLNYLRLERASSAVEALEKAIKTEPDNVLVLAVYARALRAEDRHKESLAALEQAFALNEGKVEVRMGLAEAILSQDPERAQELLKPLLVDLKDERVAWLNVQALSARKKNKEAIEFLRSAYEAQPNWTFAPMWLGRLYSLEKNGSWEARKYLMTFLRRTEPLLKQWKPETAEGRELVSSRAEAEAILTRVNQSLE